MSLRRGLAFTLYQYRMMDIHGGEFLLYFGESLSTTRLYLLLDNSPYSSRIIHFNVCKFRASEGAKSRGAWRLIPL